MRTLFIIPYVPPAYNALDSIAVALTSIHKYFQGDADIVVIGKRPEGMEGWYSAKWWRVPQCGNGPHTDMVVRILFGLHHFGRGYEGFVLWHDDMIAVNPFTLEDIQKPFALQQPILSSQNSSNYFLNDMHYTLEELAKKGLKPFNYTVHCPRWYDKTAFKELVDRYNLTERGLDFEMLYFNEQFREPEVVNRDNNHYVILMSDIYKPPLDLPLWVGLTNDFKNKEFFQALEDRVNQ